MSVAAEGAAFEEVMAEVARQGGFEATLTSQPRRAQHRCGSPVR